MLGLSIGLDAAYEDAACLHSSIAPFRFEGAYLGGAEPAFLTCPFSSAGLLLRHA